jgi:XTP/dITP diphosphohydrolase
VEHLSKEKSNIPMREIIFATNNPHKLQEISQITEGRLLIHSLKELGFNEDIPETEDSIEGNAMLKAKTIFKRFGLPCFADDTGLEVNALHGAPGVYSARYAGENASYADNVNKLLMALENHSDRSARFKTVIAYIDKDSQMLFEGLINGKILLEAVGQNGFGYDPVFVPNGYQLSFAEMDAAIKNTLSHRAIASQKLADWLLNRA